MKRLGDVARLYYNRWQHKQIGILCYQERNLYRSLYHLRGYIMDEILEEASSGARFRRFFYNELDTTHTYNHTVSVYEVHTMLNDEGFDITYEKDSFVVRWQPESSEQLK